MSADGRVFTWVYVILSGSVLTWMAWTDAHLPNCLKLYGGSAHVDDYIMCSTTNTSTVFMVQFIAIVAAFAAMAIAAVIDWAWHRSRTS